MDKRSRQAVHALITIAAAAAALYVGLALWLYASQARLVYLPNLPSRALTATPADIGLDYETVHLSTADGIQLYAWYVPAPAPRATILFFHGNAGNISQRLDTLRIMHQLELSVLIVDYRGYGRSSGRPSEHGTYLDAEAAWHYLTAVRGIASEHIVIWGRSLGAAVGAHLAAQQTPNALVMESAFISVPALGAELYPWLPVRWLTRLHYDNVATLARVSCPVLIVPDPVLALP